MFVSSKLIVLGFKVKTPAGASGLLAMKSSV